MNSPRDNPKLTQYAAAMMREMAGEDKKVLALALIAPAILRAMQYVPKGERPSVGRLRNVVLDAAAALEKV